MINKFIVSGTIPIVERLSKKLLDNIIINGDCWIYNGNINDDGYGYLGETTTQSINGNKKRHKILAHRYSYAYHKDKITEGMLIGHKCNNKSCVNPKHLYEVSSKKNGEDHSESCKQLRLFD